MFKRIALGLAVVFAAGCNSESPTELGSINAPSLHGDFTFSFSGASCAPQDIEISFSHFNSGGATPKTIGIVGSWQTIGDQTRTDLGGMIDRDTGEVVFELIVGVRMITGIFLDNDNVAAAYTDTSANCAARASGKRIGT